MKKAILLFAGMICLCGVLFGCGNKNDNVSTSAAQSTENNVLSTEETDLEESNMIDADELADIFGISVVLPENTNWIENREYHLLDENNLEITYHDAIADGDCVVFVTKNGTLILPENEYDEVLDESWAGKTASGENIGVKVQHAEDDGKTVLATWEYHEYQFAILGEVEKDSDPIPKAALGIINNLN